MSKDDLSPRYPEKCIPPSVERAKQHHSVFGFQIEGLDEILRQCEERTGSISPTGHYIQIYLKNVLKGARTLIIDNQIVATPESLVFAFEYCHDVTYIHEILHKTWRWVDNKRPWKKYGNEDEVVEILAQYMTDFTKMRYSSVVHARLNEYYRRKLKVAKGVG